MKRGRRSVVAVSCESSDYCQQACGKSILKLNSDARSLSQEKFLFVLMPVSCGNATVQLYGQICILLLFTGGAHCPSRTLIKNYFPSLAREKPDIASSKLKEAGFCLGGKSLKVLTILTPKACAPTAINCTLSSIHS